MKNYLKLVTALTMSCVLFAPLNSYAKDDISSEISKAADSVEKEVSKAADSVEKEVSDASITTKVKALYALESDIKSLEISVTTKNGIVYLSGSAETGLQANKAVELAQSVSGVKDVNNSKLVVTSSESYTQDALITAKAKGTIMRLSYDDKINSKHDLQVETTNGTVHIFGSVGNKKDVDAIKSAVKAIDGVKNVNTDIKVK